MHRPEHLESPPPGEVVELRVHGVGGATPEELLNVPLTERVAGDPAAGFFRPWLDEGRRPVLEGYSWGGLTSAARLRALWVLLAPFALVNLAGWMVRHGGEPTDVEPRPRRPLESTAVALIRVFGLVVTMAAVGYVAVGGIDLIAYQCGARPTCSGGRWWLSPWENRLVSGHLGRALVLGSFVPVAGALGLAWLARRTQQSIHPGTGRGRFSASDDPAFTVNLRHQGLWDSPHVAHRLGLTHTAAALASVGVTLAVVVERSGVADTVVHANAGWAVLLLAVMATLRLEGVRPLAHVTLAALAAVHLAVVWVVAWAAVDPPEAMAGPAPGGQVIPSTLVDLYPWVAVFTGVTVMVLWRMHREGSWRVALVAPALLLASYGMVNAFGAGLLIRLADLLGTPLMEAEWLGGVVTTQAVMVYSDAVGDTAVVTLAAFVVLLVVAGVTWLRAGAGPGCEVLAERYADRGGLDCSDPDDRAWAARVARAESVASLTDRAAAVVGTVVILVVVATTLAVVSAADPGGMRLGPLGEFLARPASVVLGFIPLVAIYLISRAYRSQPARRVVGIVWDVATFWPRWFHPWCPPAYGERAVPQLGDRLAVLTESGQVVLSGHSQGSVLAVATVVLAEGRTAARTALLTHGSPLSRLYSRYFPECFADSLHEMVVGSTRGWVNLWRPTDFIGGKVETEGVVDIEVVDPPSSRPAARGEARLLPARHSYYDRTDEYAAVLADLARP